MDGIKLSVDGFDECLKMFDNLPEDGEGFDA